MIWGWPTFLQPETGLDAHESLCTAIWTPCYPVYTLLSMRGSRISRQGGGVRVNLTKKALTTFFFFLVLSLFYWSQMVNFEKIHFSRFQTGSNIFQGVPTFYKGVQLLIPYRNPYNLWFSRGVRTPGPPDPPLDPHLLSRSAGDSFFPFSRRWVVFFSSI